MSRFPSTSIRAGRRGQRGGRPGLLTPLFLLVTLSTFAYFVSVGMVLPVLPRFAAGPLGAGSVGVGFAVGAFSLSAVVIRPFAGRIGDRRGRRLLIVGGAALVALTVAGYAAASSLASLVLLRLLTGVGEAGFFVGAASVVHDLAPEERRGEAVSFFSLALYSGVAIGPLIGEGLLDGERFDLVWSAAAIASGIAAVLALRVPDTRPRGAHAPSGGRFLHRAGVLPGIVLTTSVWGFSGFASFVPLYALELGMSGSRFVFLVYSAVILAIRSLGARIPDLLGAARTVRISLAVSIGGLLTMAMLGSPAGLFVGAILFATGQSLAFPGLMTLAVRGAPPSERGAVVGTFTAFFDLAYGLGAVSLGGVAALFGYRGVFVGGALVALAGLILFLAGGRRIERHPGGDRGGRDAG